MPISGNLNKLIHYLNDSAKKRVSAVMVLTSQQEELAASQLIRD